MDEPAVYQCKTCPYITYHRGSWKKHLLTLKHRGLKKSIEKFITSTESGKNAQ